MRLSELKISHYKSLTEVELLDIEPVTILVGCNGAGKSNIADALRFLRDAMSQGLDHAVSTRGGIGLIRQYSPTKPYRISFEFGFVDDGPANIYRYQLTLTSLREGNFRVERERCEWTGSTGFAFDGDGDMVECDPAAMRFERDTEGRVAFFVAGKSVAIENQRNVPADALAFGERLVTNEFFGGDHLGGAPLRNFIHNIRFSAIFPNTLRLPAHPDTDPILKENGANWASILRTLKKTSRGKLAWEQIKEMMQVVLPQLEDITTRAVGGFVMPQFRVREASGEAHYFDPSQISDGSLRVLGILLALYQTPHPSLMVIEEPEQTVNPALLSLLADAFREVSERTQLLITSHSPHLVDCFDPEFIRVVTMKNGETRVSPIRGSQREAVKEHLLSLEQIMSAEGLLPEEE